jgi:hypothetical protein
MEVSGIEGNFRSTCENVMQVLRTHKDSVMAMMEVWTLKFIFLFSTSVSLLHRETEIKLIACFEYLLKVHICRTVDTGESNSNRWVYKNFKNLQYYKWYKTINCVKNKYTCRFLTYKKFIVLR